MDLPTLSYLRSFLILLFVFIISSIILVIVRQVMKLFYATLISRVDNKLRLLSDAISFYDSWYFLFFNFLEWKADDVINNNHLYYTLSLMKTTTLSNCLMSSYLLQFYYDLFLGYLVSSYIYVFLQLGLIRIILLGVALVNDEKKQTGGLILMPCWMSVIFPNWDYFWDAT